MTSRNNQEIVCVVGLGYVGLPLAVALSKKVKTIGFDISEQRIEQLKNNDDWTNELSQVQLASANIDYTTNPEAIKRASFVIVAVPTPVSSAKVPNLVPVIGASTTVGKNLAKDAVVVLESTVYPGVTTDVMVPILERESGLKCGQDFFVGYSPERINPGDHKHTLETVIKVVSGMDAKTLDRVAKLYETVCEAGVFRASSIKVAEAAKVIENVQRDLNIALMNELSVIFHKLGIPTHDVLAAAESKWNFLKFYPGLVGGHCIGVDPYYLTFKAQEVGYHPQIILAGRRVNDGMPKFAVDLLVKCLIEVGKPVKGAKVLILGVTFKENVKDCRNSRVADLIKHLSNLGVRVLANDSMMEDEVHVVKKEFGIGLTSLENLTNIDAVIFAVPHNQYNSLTLQQLKQMMPTRPVLLDLRTKFDRVKALELGFVIEQL